MMEVDFHQWLCFAVIAIAVIVFFVLLFITAPYGRHARGGWGPTVSNRVGWILMETPSLLTFLIVYSLGQYRLHPAPLCLCALWTLHYGHRSFVFPLRLKSARKPMALSVAAMGILFNLINGYLNARWISCLGSYPLAWLADPRFVIGASAFFLGMAINVQSDGILFSLRKPGEQGYRIPFGGAYRWVSSPNYMGELIEWGGFAIACWSLAALSFFLFTFANLVPRAIAHHAWYKTTFPDYPRERRAVIPWLV